MARVYLKQEDGKRPHLFVDGRCDTPGFSSKFCHYSFMLYDTKEIIHTEVMQVNERFILASSVIITVASVKSIIYKMKLNF